QYLNHVFTSFANTTDPIICDQACGGEGCARILPIVLPRERSGYTRHMRSAAEQIVDAGLIVIIRTKSSEHLVEAARALEAGGVRAMEITLNTPGALAAIAAIRSALPTMICGAGTILSPDDAV